MMSSTPMSCFTCAKTTGPSPLIKAASLFITVIGSVIGSVMGSVMGSVIGSVQSIDMGSVVYDQE